MASDISRISVQVPPEDRWTEQEKWIWNQASKGEIASFNKRYFQSPDPAQTEGWTENRIVSPEFIYEVLSRGDLRNSLPRTGLRIEGAIMVKPLDLHNLILNIEFWIDKSRFEKKVDLSYLRTDSPVSFEGSFFKEDVSFRLAEVKSIINMSKVKVLELIDMESIHVGSHVFLGSGSEMKDISLMNAEIVGHLYIHGSKVLGYLNMNTSTIGSTLFLGPNSEFNKVELIGSKIGGQLQAHKIKIKGLFDASTVFVKGALIMSEGSEFFDVNISSSEVMGPVDMSKSLIMGTLTMTGFKTSNFLQMYQGTYNGLINMTGASIDNKLIIAESSFMGILNMNQIKVGDVMIIEKCKEINEVVLYQAKINSSLSILGSKFSGILDMRSSFIGKSLTFDDYCEFSELYLDYVEVVEQVFISKSKFKVKLSINSGSIGKSFFIRDGCELNNMNFVRVKVGDQFLIDNSAFLGETLMSSIIIGENLIFNGCKFKQEIILSNSNLEGSVYFYGSELSGIDLSNTIIRGNLEMGTPYAVKNQWMPGSMTNLRNAKLSSIQDGGTGTDMWSERLDLNGFLYSFLGGQYQSNKDNTRKEIAERDESWFIEWLERNQGYSPQPYHHMAGVLKNMGYHEKSTYILYACKKREMKEALKTGHWIKWIGMNIIDWTIGFGFGARYFRSLIWIAALSLIGVLVMYTVPPEQLYFETNNTFQLMSSFWIKLGFSIDRLLPFIWLDERFRFTFDGWQLYYFYFHQLMGFLLGSIIIAGLSGITRK